MTTTTIAAIIPLYNGRDFIAQSLNSVLSQTRPSDEIIVVDDGSTDDGAALALGIAGDHPAFRLLRKRNGGQSSARNYGVRKSTGSLIAFLDQDDAWYPHHLEVLERPFLEEGQHESLGWVYSNLDRIDREGRMVTRRFLPMDAIHPKSSVLHCIDRDMFVLPSASLISREAFARVGGFDERLVGYEDDDLFLRLFQAGYQNRFIDEALSQWRIYSASTSYSPAMARSRLIYAQKLLAAFPDAVEENTYGGADAIAPRFIRNFAFDAAKGVRLNQRSRTEAALPALRLLSRRVRTRDRMLLALALAVLRHFWLARIANALGLSRLAHRALRRRRQLTPR